MSNKTKNPLSQNAGKQEAFCFTSARKVAVSMLLGGGGPNVKKEGSCASKVIESSNAILPTKHIKEIEHTSLSLFP